MIFEDDNTLIYENLYGKFYIEIVQSYSSFDIGHIPITQENIKRLKSEWEASLYPSKVMESRIYINGVNTELVARNLKEFIRKNHTTNAFGVSKFHSKLMAEIQSLYPSYYPEDFI